MVYLLDGINGPVYSNHNAELHTLAAFLSPKNGEGFSSRPLTLFKKLSKNLF